MGGLPDACAGDFDDTILCLLVYYLRFVFGHSFADVRTIRGHCELSTSLSDNHSQNGPTNSHGTS